MTLYDLSFTPVRRKKGIELFLLLLLSISSGSAFGLAKIGIETIPPITLAAARTTIACGILFLFVKCYKVTIPRNLYIWKAFFVQACLNTVIPFTIIAWAQRTVDITIVTILNSSAPIFSFIIILFVKHGEDVGIHRVIAAFVGLFGICLLVGVNAFDASIKMIVPQLAVVFAAICYASSTIYGQNFKKFHPILPAMGSLLCGALVLVPASFIIDMPWRGHFSQRSLFALLILSIFQTAFGLLIYFRLINTIGSIATTAQSYLRIPISIAIGVFFFEEGLTVTSLIGLIIVLGSVAAMTVSKAKREDRSI